MEIWRQTQQRDFFWKLHKDPPAVFHMFIPLHAGGLMPLAPTAVQHFHVCGTEWDSGGRSGLLVTGLVVTGLLLPEPPPCPFYSFSPMLCLFIGFSNTSHQLPPLPCLWHDSSTPAGSPQQSTVLEACRTLSKLSGLIYVIPVFPYFFPQLPHLLQHCSWSQFAVLYLASSSVPCGLNPSDLGKS